MSYLTEEEKNSDYTLLQIAIMRKILQVRSDEFN